MVYKLFIFLSYLRISFFYLVTSKRIISWNKYFRQPRNDHRSFRSTASAMLDDHSFPEGISSPVAAHIFDFCDDGSGGDLFAAVNAVSDMFTPSSEEASSSSAATPPLCSHGENMSSGAAATAFSPMPTLDSTLPALLEQEQPPGPDAELLLPIDYTFAAAADEPQPEQQFGQMALPVITAEHPALQTQMSSTASELMQLPSGYSEECFAAALAGGYMGLDETLCQQQSGAMLPGGVGEAVHGCFFGKEAAQGGFFGSGGDSCTGMVMSMMGMEEIGEYQRMMEGGAGALVGTHSDADSAVHMAFANAAAEMQMGGSVSPGRLPATETSSLEETSFKGARLSVEERKEKIHRYIKKRNERNFSKKIKYACRKTLADSRPRVRGRFAKNDDCCEASRAIGSQNHEEYERIASVKEDMLDSDALAHFSGMNSYMYNHTVESRI